MSRPLATKGKCINCRHEDATHAGECRPCHAVTLLMVGTIQEHWPIDDYRQLGDELQNSTVKEFRDKARSSQSVFSWKLGENLFRLASLSGLHCEEFKRRVINRMRDNLREFEQIEDHPDYMCRIRLAIGELLAFQAKP